MYHTNIHNNRNSNAERRKISVCIKPIFFSAEAQRHSVLSEDYEFPANREAGFRLCAPRLFRDDKFWNSLTSAVQILANSAKHRFQIVLNLIFFLFSKIMAPG
jgi:hypothetical protein